MHCLPFDPNIRTAWMKFIFNDVPDCVNKTLFVCSLHFTADSFLNKIQFIAGFSETLKIKDDAVPTTLDPAVMLQHTSMSNIFFYYVSLLLCLLQIHWYVLSIHTFFNQNDSYSTPVMVGHWKLPNHSSGHLLLCLECVTPIKMECFKERVKNRIEN